jgi:hypothetical protein
MSDVDIDCPADDNERGEQRCRRYGCRCWLRTPGDRNRRDDEYGESGERQRIVPARQHQQGRRDEIGAERGRRHVVDSADLRIRSEEEASDDQRGRERKACDNMEEVRPERVDTDDADPRQGPRRAEHDRGDGEPAPHSHPRERKGGSRHHREIDVERPIVGLLGGDEQRRQIGADKAEARQRLPVQKRGRERRQRHQTEHDEG